jgi:glycosyltransferase involved in cell wall biosynthesis
MTVDGKSVRVVIFLPSIETGGVERNAIIVANHLVDYGFYTSIAYTRIVKTMRCWLDKRILLTRIGKHVKIPFIHPRIIDALAIFRGFMNHLKTEKRHGKTVILSFQSNIVSIIAARLVGVPIVVRVSNHPSHIKYESGIVRRIAELLKLVFYRYADVVITNSEVTSDYFRCRLPVPIRTIYNPLDSVSLIKKAREIPKHPWLQSKELPVVIAVGRLVGQKNFALLIKSFSEVLKRVDARLIILGEGEERKNLELLINSLRLEDKIDVPGYHPNVHHMVAKADLFVLSSNYEGLPNALLEALAVGTPAVSTNCLSGPSEILCEGNGGDLVPINDRDALAVAIVTNLTKPERAQQMLLKAKEKLKNSEKDKILIKYIELLKSVAIGQ